MTACYGFRYSTGRETKCVRCGEGFYEHSHLEAELSTGRTQRAIIRLNIPIGTQTGTENGELTYRSAYDRMMDRQPGASEWFKAVQSAENDKGWDL